MQIKKLQQFKNVPWDAVEKVNEIFYDQLISNIRYERYVKNESKQEWVELLGPDVLFFSHPFVVAELADKYLKVNDHIKEKDLFITAAYVHDWGELIVDGYGIGDITLDLQNNDLKEKEKKVFEKVLDKVNCTESDLEKLRTAYYDIALTDDTELGKKFHIVECLSYFKTTFRAFDGKEGKFIEHRLDLPGNTFSSQIQVMLDFAKDDKYAENYLKQNAQKINEIFNELKTYLPNKDKTGMDYFKPENIEKALYIWNSYKKITPLK